jgi:Homeodomain
MNRLFKESPHPDEKQRQQLSKQLGLSARQVKFWFQNRRTQMKVSLIFTMFSPNTSFGEDVYPNTIIL